MKPLFCYFRFLQDYIRLYALNEYGGIYLDSDVEVLRSFNDILNNKSFIGYDSTEAIEAAIIGAEPSTDWIKKALEYYDDRHFILPNGDLDTRPIPRMIKNVLENEYRISLFSPTEISELENITIYPSHYFSPKNYQTHVLHTSSNTYCIHHFDGKWVNKSFRNRLKEKIHEIIYKVGGDKFHTKIVKLIRNIKK